MGVNSQRKGPLIERRPEVVRTIYATPSCDCRYRLTVRRSLDFVAPRSLVFLPNTIDAVMDRACRQAGLDPTGARLLRLGENMLYQLSGDSAVVRIARDMQHWQDASKEVAIA